MKILKMQIVVLSLFFLGCNFQEPDRIQPKVTAGTIDLTHWDFEKNGSVSLDGEWEFYWGEFLNSKIAEGKGSGLFKQPESGNQKVEQNFMPVPARWQLHGYPEKGFATYRIRILLPDNIPKMAIANTYIASAYSLYINGKLASSKGKTGKSEIDSSPYMQSETFPVESFLINSSLKDREKSTTVKSNANEILIHVSNFHESAAGIWNPIKIGPTTDIYRNVKKKFVLDLLVFTSIFTMGLYHFGLYFNRRKDSSAFHFGAFCILLSIRIVCTNDRMILDAFPFLSFFLIHKIQVICFYFGCFLFMQFVCSIFPDEFSVPRSRMFFWL
ncbi:MAG: hypothetical protein K8R21_05040 [Leptospira sp.]|nr:hypothetical protein [Leptospira sp.]